MAGDAKIVAYLAAGAVGGDDVLRPHPVTDSRARWSVTDTPSSPWVRSVSSVLGLMSAPSATARLRRMGSSRSWAMAVARSGEYS